LNINVHMYKNIQHNTHKKVQEGYV